MGGCATKPKVSKGDETEASPPVSKEEVEEKEVATVGEVAAKDEGVVIDNDTKRQSLGFLFEVKYINAWSIILFMFINFSILNSWFFL